MIDHDVSWLHISVHDPSRVHKVECLREPIKKQTGWQHHRGHGLWAHLEQLKRIILDVQFVQHGKERFPLHVLHVLHDETLVARRGVLDDVSEGDNVRTPREVTKHFDFTFDLAWGDGLEDFDDAGLRVDHVDAFEDLCGRDRVLCTLEMGPYL